MSYIHQRFILKALQHNLQHTTYEPLLSGCCYAAPFYPHVTLSKDVSTGKLKNTLQIFGLLALSLPVSASLPSSALDTLDHIQLSNQLTVASDGDEFSLEMAKEYAQMLGVGLDVQNFDSEQQGKNALMAGEVDLLISKTAQSDTKRHSLHCGAEAGYAFSFRQDNERLAQHAKNHLCQPDIQRMSANIAKFYHYYPNDYSHDFFVKTLEQKLPLYQVAFENYAARYDHDWRLLVAVAYQESQLSADAVSPTGVQGLMMLTRDTAAEMGIADRTDPIQSIKGGAKYLKRLQSHFADLPDSERLWFVLAGYNMGPTAVRNVQEKVRLQGKNPNRWVNIYDYLATHAHENSRYGQCLHYVTGVRYYLSVLKQQ